MPSKIDKEAALFKNAANLAGKYHNRRFDLWELVNVAYCDKNFRNVRVEFASNAAYWAMIRYIRKETKYSQWKKAEEKGQKWPTSFELSQYDYDPLECLLDEYDNSSRVDARDALSRLEDKRKRQIVWLRCCGYTYNEIGVMFEITGQRSSQIYREAIQFLRRRLCEN